MFRLRFAMLLMAAGIVLVSGCIGLSHHPLLSRLRGTNSADCCDGEALPDCEMPLLDSGGPVILPPPTPLPGPNGAPRFDPQDRLEPVPESRRTPASPSGRTHGSRQLESLGDKKN